MRYSRVTRATDCQGGLLRPTRAPDSQWYLVTALISYLFNDEYVSIVIYPYSSHCCQCQSRNSPRFDSAEASATVKFEGRQMKQCWIKYLKILNNPPWNFEQKTGWRLSGALSTYICIEYHSVCPLVRIGTPLSRKWVCPVHPSGTKAGDGHTWLRVSGSHFRRLEKTPSTLSTVVCGVGGFKGTQDWEFFWLRFWNLRYVKILRFYKKKFWLAHYWERYDFSA